MPRKHGGRLLAVAAAATIPLGTGPATAQTARAPREALVQALEFVRAGDCTSAEPLLKQVLSGQPWNVGARRLLGRCLLDAGRWDEARPHFEALLALAPDDASALSGLREAVAAGQKVESARQVEQIESRRTRAEQLRAQYEMRDAENLVLEGRKANAEQALLAIMAKRPEEPAAGVRLAELYSSTRRFKEAALLFERLSQNPDASTRHRLRAAQNHEWSGDDTAAISSYRRYLEREGNDRTAREALGRALVRVGRCDEAVGELAVVAGRDGSRTSNPAVALDLARCHDRLKHADLALAAYENAARLDPRAEEARRIVEQRRRDAEQAPLRRAYAAIEVKDHEAAARELGVYLEAHPGDADARLQLARVLSWSNRFEPSTGEYRRYLQVRADDSSARRELAQVLAWRGLNAEAILQYRALAEGAAKPGDAIEDLESVLRLQLQSGDLKGAGDAARSLLAARPGHEAATQVLAEAAARRRTAALQAAQALTADGRYQEAIEAYKRYQEEYGAEPELGLLVSRLHSWARDYEGAIAAYRAYLTIRPDDAGARAELAAVLSWASRASDAEKEYATLLSRNPGDVTATLRLTQIRDQRGDDRVEVLRSYEGILEQDATVAEARDRAQELRHEVGPRPRFLADRFVDSDDLTRLSTTFEVNFMRAGRMFLTPLIGYLNSEQPRLVPGGGAEIRALNAEIAKRGGQVQGGGLGLRVEARRENVRVAAEAMVLRFDTDRTSLNGRFDLSLDRGPAQPGFALQYVRREAVYDVSSGATLVAGIMGDTVLVSGWRALGPAKQDGSPRFRAWLAAGVSFFSGGSTGAFDSNRQDRLSGRLSLEVSSSASLAYVLRHSRFRERSPLYFSPARDTVHLLSGAFSTRGSKLRGTVLVEAGYESIDGESVTPLLVQPGVEWRARKDLPIRLSWRYGRSGASAFGSSTYSSQGFEIAIGSSR